jgi:hypothetical protein
MDKITQTKKIINLTQLQQMEIDKIKLRVPNPEFTLFWQIYEQNKLNIDKLDSLIEKWTK